MRGPVSKDWYARRYQTSFSGLHNHMNNLCTLPRVHGYTHHTFIHSHVTQHTCTHHYHSHTPQRTQILKHIATGILENSLVKVAALCLTVLLHLHTPVPQVVTI